MEDSGYRCIRLPQFIATRVWQLKRRGQAFEPLLVLRCLRLFSQIEPYYDCASTAFDARVVLGTSPSSYGKALERAGFKRVETTTRSVNLSSPGPLCGKVTQGSQRTQYLGGWWCKGPSEEVDGRCRGRLPPENPQILWGDLVQRQRTEMSRIWSCWQG